jgi:FdhD protein
MSTFVRRPTTRVRVRTIEDGRTIVRDDDLVTEEPLEIRVSSGDRPPSPVAVTMRTPGADFELAAGFLATEGVIRAAGDVAAIRYCADPGEQHYNVVTVDLQPGLETGITSVARNFYVTSSCGVCGKASIEALRAHGVASVAADDVVASTAVIGSLGDRLKAAQSLFARTGGLHGAGVFTSDGELLAAREDVGRHNAVDKLVGWALLERRLPLAGTILMVSGRASFELVQKAAVAGIPILVAVSAPSSLARQAAVDLGMTLVGFARGRRCNVYAGGHRVVSAEPAAEVRTNA